MPALIFFLLLGGLIWLLAVVFFYVLPYILLFAVALLLVKGVLYLCGITYIGLAKNTVDEDQDHRI